MINNTETTIKDGGGGGTTNTPTGNGGSTFVCSKCGRTCDCGNMSVENNICQTCYEEFYIPPINKFPDPEPDPDGGTTFVCSECGRTCDCGNMSAEEGVCIYCYCPDPEPDPDPDPEPEPDPDPEPEPNPDPDPEPEPEPETPTGNGGTTFWCEECKRVCDCKYSTEYEGICSECFANLYGTGLHNWPGKEEGDFRCFQCGRKCKSDEESYIGGVCIECCGPGGDKFRCSECGNVCECTTESCLEGVCCDCYKKLPKCPICNMLVKKADKYCEGCDFCKTCAEKITVSIVGANTLAVGEQITLNAIVTCDEEKVDVPVSWSSSATDVADVDSNGTITALEEGTATITATVAERTCVVHSVEIVEKNNGVNACISDLQLSVDGIIKLFNAGYRKVGRYLNNHTFDRYVPKNHEFISKSECNNFASAGVGMDIFSIFHEYKIASDFSILEARYEVETATFLAEQVGQPRGTKIYFEIDDKAGASGCFESYALEIKEQMSSSGYGFGFVCTEKVKKVLDYSSLGISESDVIVMDATFVSNDNYIRPYLSDSLLPAGVRSDMDFSNADISVWKCTYEDLSSQTTTSEIWETEGLNRKIGIDTPSAFPNLDCERARASQSDYNNPNSDFYFEKIGEYSEISKPGDSDGESIILERIPWSFYKYIDGDGTLSYDNFNHDVRFVGRYLNYLSGAHSKMEISDTEMICNGTPIDVYSLYQCNAPVGYYNENQGYYDALVAIMQAKKVGQPSHKPIYFCVDTNVLADDAFRMEDDKSPRICEIISYFDGIYNCFINKTINNFEYEIGIYSCGFACQSVEKFLKSKPNSRYVYVMLAGAISFAGTAESRVDENTWNIMQDVILHDDYIYDEESDDIKKVEDLSCYGRYDLNTSSSKRGIGGWHRQNG